MGVANTGRTYCDVALFYPNQLHLKGIIVNYGVTWSLYDSIKVEYGADPGKNRNAAEGNREKRKPVTPGPHPSASAI